MRALVRVDDLEPGQIVADQIYDNINDYLLVSEGVILDEKMIWRLKERRVSAIHIVDTLITPEEMAIEHSRLATATSLSAFVDDLYSAETVCLEPLHKALDGIIGRLTADSTIMVYLQRISVHDNSVLDHLVDVAIYSTLVGLSCGLSREDLTVMGTGALLHDIGKLGIEQQLLAKPSALTDNEYEVVKRHPEHGYQQLKRVKSLDERARRISLEHHERLDGSGYPNALHGNDIHLFSKITAVCDVYDALVMERSYRKAYSPDQAAIILRSFSNLDQGLIEALLSHLVIYPVGTKVRLNNGAVGLVIRAQISADRRTLVRLLLTPHNEGFILKRKLEVVEITGDIRIDGVLSDDEYEQYIAQKLPQYEGRHT